MFYGKFFLLLLLFFSVMACSVESKPTSISGKITLSPALSSKVGPSDILFIIALPLEAPDSSKKRLPPLAMQKIAPATFPVKYTLSQNDVIFPDRKFEGKLTIIARIDKDGEAALAKKGDLEGQPKKNPVPVGTKNADITINKERQE